MFGLPRWMRLAFRAHEITQEARQSIGAQAYARVQVSQRVLAGDKPTFENGKNDGQGGGSVVFADGSRYGCGFLNMADAMAFSNHLRLLEIKGYRVAIVQPYSESPDSYRLEGWVKTVYPPRCNAKYCEDWDRYPGEVPVIDLGAVEARF